MMTKILALAPFSQAKMILLKINLGETGTDNILSSLLCYCILSTVVQINVTCCRDCRDLSYLICPHCRLSWCSIVPRYQQAGLMRFRLTHCIRRSGESCQDMIQTVSPWWSDASGVCHQHTGAGKTTFSSVVTDPGITATMVSHISNNCCFLIN